MAAILDNKTRVMDVVVTSEGKRQIGSGDFKIAYATFTDRHTYYDKSSISGSYDSATSRPFLEATSLAFDQITVESDDSGAVIPFATIVANDGTRVNAVGGNITSNGEILAQASTPKYGELSTLLIQSSLENFKKQMIIASRDPLDESETFELSVNDLTFNYGNRGPLVGPDIVSTVDQADSVFTDKRFSNAPNFMFMPPVAKSNAGETVLGQYTDIRKSPSYTYNDIMKELVGKVPDQPICPNTMIEFVETTLSNDICIQAFEIGQNLKKLDMVDFGYVTDATGPTPIIKRIIFLGKIYVDRFGASNFANIFTLVLE